MKIAYKNLGCKVNSYELDKIKKDFFDNGFIEVRFDDVADIYIVNTCSVTSIADKKSRQMLNKSKKLNKKSIVVAIGCFVDANVCDKKNKTYKNIDLWIKNEYKKNTFDIVNEYIQKNINKCDCDSNLLNNKNLNDKFDKILKNEICVSSSERIRTTIKIEDGCNQFCSYCIIPYLRGRVKSVNENVIIDEITQKIKNGAVEVILTGIHISSYGLDFINMSYESEEGREKVRDLIIELLKKISNIDEIERIRLGSLEPRIITENFLKRIISYQNLQKKFCTSFHLSLQSGSDEILKKMNRKYTTCEFKNSVDLIRKFFIDSTITTDIIVGFPTETEKNFLESLSFVKEIRFYNPNIFRYSMRKGTKAEKMVQVDEDIKNIRSKIMIEETKKITDEENKKMINKTVEILVEEKEEDKKNSICYLVGYTKDYKKIKIPYSVLENCKKIGKLLTCTVYKIENNYLLAKI